MKKNIIILIISIIVISFFSITIYENIKVNYYTINTEVLEGKGRIEISPLQESYKEGTEITVKAIPEEGYEFLNWGERFSSPFNKRELEVSYDLVLRAKFTDKIKWKRKVDIGDNNFRWTSEDVIKADKERVYLLTSEGKLFSFDMDGEDKWKFDYSENLDEDDFDFDSINLLLKNDKVYVVLNQNIFSFGQNGNKLWEYELSTDDKNKYWSNIKEFYIDEEENIYILSKMNKFIYVNRENDEIQELSFSFLGNTSMSVNNNNEVFIINSVGDFYSIDITK